MVKVDLIYVQQNFADVSKQDADQLIVFKYNRHLSLPITILSAAALRWSLSIVLILASHHNVCILHLDDSSRQREHMVVHELFETHAWLAVPVLGLSYLDQRLQKVLKVHVTLVTIDGAEN